MCVARLRSAAFIKEPDASPFPSGLSLASAGWCPQATVSAHHARVPHSTLTHHTHSSPLPTLSPPSLFRSLSLSQTHTRTDAHIPIGRRALRLGRPLGGNLTLTTHTHHMYCARTHTVCQHMYHTPCTPCVCVCLCVCREALKEPWGVVVDGDGRILVSDLGHHRIMVYER